MENKNIEYVVGIDLGHGETSAAICPMQWDKSVSDLDDVKDLEMGSNKKAIPSAITIIDENTAYIGDAAFDPGVLKKATLRVCFKQAPKDITGDAEKIMIRFMKEVYKCIRQKTPGTLTDTNHIVYIATPSGWDSAAQQLYVHMAKLAGMPIAGVTKESRAAFVKAQQDTTTGIGRNIENGAIVFDMGSSTLDFTYMNKRLPNLIDNGYDCGASRVEKLIFGQKEQESESIRLFEQKYPKLVDYLLFAARTVKEQVYYEPTLSVKKNINFDDIIDDEDLEDERFKLAFKPGDLNMTLEQAGYIREIEEAMLDYKKKFIPDQEIYGVFLTGGASRMDFIPDLVKRCWGVDNVYRDTDPSLTISRGVAEVARLDLRTSGMDEGIEEMINHLKNSDEIYESFVDKFGYHLWDKITDAVAGKINQWAEADWDYTLINLRDWISKAVKETVEEESPMASEFIKEAIDEHTHEIQEKVNDIIASYAEQGMATPSLAITAVVPKIDGIDLSDVISGISEQLTSESSGLGTVLGSAAIGAVLGFLGPLGWIAGGTYLLGKAIFGEEKSEEQKRQEAMSKSLDYFQRQKILVDLETHWEEMQVNIKDSILASLTNDLQIVDTISSSVEQILESYKENLKSARILID